MFKLEILCIFTYLYTLHGESILGKGLWSIISVDGCPEENLKKEVFKWDVNKHKLNRTHDGISAHITVSEKVTKLYGLYIDVCKFVDGGCKPYQIIAGNLGQMSDQYAKHVLIKMFKWAKNKHEYYPVEKGEYDLEDYMIDYCDIPPICMYGKYQISIYLTSYLQRVACTKMVTECKKCEEDEDCCDSKRGAT